MLLLLFRGLLSTLLFVLVSCQKSSIPIVKYTNWTNPITQYVVTLPKGWRYSPTMVQKSPTAIGYFAPQFAAVHGKYGHITLHYEDMALVVPQQNLPFFVDNFAAHMRQQMFQIGRPNFTSQGMLHSASVIAEGRHERRDVRLKAKFWTVDKTVFWYAIIESELENTTLIASAEALVESLVTSTMTNDGS